MQTTNKLLLPSVSPGWNEDVKVKFTPIEGARPAKRERKGGSSLKNPV